MERDLEAHNGLMTRSADWLRQAQADVDQARVSAEAGHHEWACFAAHQAVEKAVKAIHLHLGQQVWGHGLGCSSRDLPAGPAATLAAAVPDLEERLRILDALYIPMPYPDSLPVEPKSTTLGAFRVRTPAAMPMRSLPHPPGRGRVRQLWQRHRRGGT